MKTRVEFVLGKQRPSSICSGLAPVSDLVCVGGLVLLVGAIWVFCFLLFGCLNRWCIFVGWICVVAI